MSTICVASYFPEKLCVCVSVSCRISLVLKSPHEATASAPWRGRGAPHARLYLPPFSSLSSPRLYLFSLFPSLGPKSELCLYMKCVHWENYDNTTHILRLLVVLVVILILITFLMHLSNFVYAKYALWNVKDL